MEITSIREWLNGSLLPLSIFLTVIIAAHLNNVRKLIGKGWTDQPGVRVSCALGWLFAAETIRSLIVWAVLRTQNDGYSVTEFDAITSAGYVGSACVLVAGMLRCIYLFSPKRYKRSLWIAAVITVLLFLIASEFIPPFAL